MANCIICAEFDNCPWRSDPYAQCSEYKERPLTNADRVRSMTDEELALLLARIADCGGCKIATSVCMRSEESCTNAWLEWLEEEATDGQS